MKGWDGDKAWSDVFMPQVCAILASVLKVDLRCVAIADQTSDQKQNTDVFVAISAPHKLRVACRIREHKWAKCCGDEFTIRSKRSSGQQTELRKIQEGYGDFLFYGFADVDAARVERWRILNLHAFRSWLKAADVPVVKSNTDGSSEFAVYRVVDIPGIVAFESGSEVAVQSRRIGHDVYGNAYPPSWDLI